MESEYNIVQPPPLNRIVVIGPESTGKSTLARQLASCFDTAFADEYARSYLEQLDRPYTLADMEAMARGQLGLERKAVAGARHGLYFCDTDLYVFKVWSEDRYGSCPEEILRDIATRACHLYILTDIDMPWQDDPLREHPEPEMRQYFFHIYHDIVQHSGVPFIRVYGDEAQRLRMGQDVIKKMGLYQ